jgi:DNA-binding XRE family transcriptional regulator
LEKEENLVKKTCRELGITQKKLAEKIGITESGLKTAISKNNFSMQIKKNIELLLENQRLQNELKQTEALKSTLKELLS